MPDQLLHRKTLRPAPTRRRPQHTKFSPFALQESTGIAVRSRPNALLLPLYLLTLFLSSALLFLVEPMFAKMMLPLLGGTPAVWNTCMVFFQVCVLAGYAYAHWSIRWLGVGRQCGVQVVLLAVTAFCLPVGIRGGWTPPAHGNPVFAMLGMMTLAVGLPFFVVSTTAPLLQRWFTSTRHRAAADPYFLYAASNLGSMLALLAYPSVIEPLLRLAQQTHLWSAGYVLLAVLTGLCAIFAWRSPAEVHANQPAPRPISLRRRLRWILLAFIPSSLLLGVTTFITTDIAAVPLLWVVPLALYLLSFILVFMRKPLIARDSCVRAMPMLVLAAVFLLLAHIAQPLWMVLTLHLLAFFAVCMVCHGELATDRPSTGSLTDFYLMMSLGGVLGGLFNALLAPILFNVAAEYPIALVLSCLMCPGIRRVRIAARVRNATITEDASAKVHPAKGTPWPLEWDLLIPAIVGFLAWRLPFMLPEKVQLAGGSLRIIAAGIPVLLSVSAIRRPVRFALCIGAMLASAVFAGSYRGQLLAVHRSFFGVHRIVATPEGPFNDLYHGSTVHGRQLVDSSGAPIHPDEPLTYYSRSGPMGHLFAELPTLAGDGKLRIGVVGLGVGSLAAYAGHGTSLTYHEIDPVVLWAAQESGRFTFLSSARDRGADVRVILGDARLTLHQVAAQHYDLLVLDAFSGDAVPAHLLTREAMRLYLDKLSGTGILAVHISNIYLDLKPVVAALADDAHCVCYSCDDIQLKVEEGRRGKMPSQWIVIAREEPGLFTLTRDPRWVRLHAPEGFRVWTDDFSNVLGSFRWRK